MTENNLFPDYYRVKDVDLILNKGFYLTDNYCVSFIPIYFWRRKPLLYLKITINTENNNEINYDVVTDNNKLYYGFYRRDAIHQKFNSLLDKKILEILNQLVKDGLFHKVRKNKPKKNN